MALLNSFLCCFDLETGGVVISWFGMICTFVGIVVILVLSLLTALNPCPNGSCAAPLVGFLILLLIVIGFFLMYRSLNVGVKTRDYRKVLPSLIMSGISTFLGASSLFAAITKHQTEGIGGAIFWMIIQIYCFLIIRELYVKFKSEKKRPRHGV